MVIKMLLSENPHEACIGQVLVRPFLHKNNIKEFLLNLWGNTKHRYLKAGLLFDLFEYEDLDKQFREEACRYIEDNKKIVLTMLNEWLEGEDKIIQILQNKLSKNGLKPHKKVLYEQMLRLAQDSYITT